MTGLPSHRLIRFILRGFVLVRLMLIRLVLQLSHQTHPDRTQMSPCRTPPGLTLEVRTRIPPGLNSSSVPTLAGTLHV